MALFVRKFAYRLSESFRKPLKSLERKACFTYRNDRGDRGNVGIIRSPVRASILPDLLVLWVPNTYADIGML